MKSRREGNAKLVLNEAATGKHPGSIRTSKSPRNTPEDPTKGKQLADLSLELRSKGKGSSKSKSTDSSPAQAKRMIAAGG